MKKILWLSTLTTMAAVSVSAHAEGAYAGLSFGQSRYHYTAITGSQVVTQLNQLETLRVGAPVYSNYTAPVYSTLNKNSTGYKLFGGYAFTKNWSLEAGYADFETLKLVFYNLSAETQAKAFYVTSKGTLPLNETFSLFAKIGAASVRHKGFVGYSRNMPVNSFSGSDANLLAGAGVGYNFEKNVVFSLEYENFGKVDAASNPGKISMISMSAHYNF